MKAKRYIKLISAFWAFAMMATSCIYPYVPDIESKSGLFVVEGDILIGEVSRISLSCVYEFASNIDREKDPKAYVSIESEDGKVYTDKILGSDHSIDMSGAPDNVRYRLVIDRPSNGHHYQSDWKEVQSAAAMDELGYSLVQTEYDNIGAVAISVGMRGTEGGSRYFRLSYDEIWEYHSSHRAVYRYYMGSVVPFTGGENTYYCWKRESSSQIMLFSTEGQSQNRYEIEFNAIMRNDNRLQEVYYTKVYLQALDEDGYRYWRNTQESTGQRGDLLAPIPSSMRGNISCQEDPDEMIYGYISAARRVYKELYIDNNNTRFYTPPKDDAIYTPEYVEPSMWQTRYTRDNMRPYTLETAWTGDEYFTWLPARCVDCTQYGGTKSKPEGWPRPEI